MSAEACIAITLLAIAVLIEGWFIVQLHSDLVKQKAEQGAAIAAVAAAADKARKLGEAAQRRISRFKQSLQGDLK